MTSPFAQMLHLPAQRSLGRNGDLHVLDLPDQLPFAVRRVFWVGALRLGDRRGGHANTLVHEALVCVGGAIRIRARHAGREHTFDLTEPGQVLVLPPTTWVDIEVLQDDSLFVVFASHEYHAAEPHYIRDPHTFRERYG